MLLLPREYDAAAFRAYWTATPGRRAELAGRWASFAGAFFPLLARVGAEAASGRLRGDVAVQRSVAASLVRCLEGLGPAFVKAGQALSVRPDVVGQPAAEELTRLQDAVAPVRQAQAEAVLMQELAALGHVVRDAAGLDALLLPSASSSQPVPSTGAAVAAAATTVSWFSAAKPVASASLAQVYRARLPGSVGGVGGGEVAVKVQRPGLRRMVRARRDSLGTLAMDIYSA